MLPYIAHNNFFVQWTDVDSLAGLQGELINVDVTLPEDQVLAEPGDDPLEEDRAEENNSMPSSEPFEVDDRRMVCRRSGLSFPTNSSLKLLTLYDDQVRAALPPFPTEQVFCRICREGLHDDAEEIPAAAGDEADISQFGDHDPHEISQATVSDGMGSPTFEVKQNRGPVLPHPKYTAHTELMKNPMLAPCECAGSMAFVHYLCVEQWRCRSRHPAAKNGLNCETCKAPYALPLPENRHAPIAADNDWQDAMPLHVIQALRQPHIWWQIGAMIVRRRALRPLAPVVMSPLVALYCRARRLLKKRGVARRRWACSLCRRRARWKCVRCLRSYYCSRQCQNVSWHIIHKHVCYEPARFYQSVAFYGALAITLFPGSLRDPIMYEIGLALVPLSFVIMGFLGVGAATLLKKLAGVDVRGRRMELLVILATVWFSLISLGLLRAFFGKPGSCYGASGRYAVSADDLSSTFLLRFLHWVLFKPSEYFFRFIDSKFASILRWTGSCTHKEGSKCLEHIGSANASFFIRSDPSEEAIGAEQCASDLLLVCSLYIAAALSFVFSSMLKQHERQLRRRRHLHQD